MNNPPPTESIKQHYSGAFLVIPSGRVIGQHRDDKPEIDNPGKVSAFGGTVEPGEDPVTAVWREVTKEETNLVLEKSDFIPLCNQIAWRVMTQEWEVLQFFYVKINERAFKQLEVFEGQGWAYITGPNDPNIVDNWRPAVKKLFEILSKPI